MVSGRSTQIRRTGLVFFVALAVFCMRSPASITPTGSIDPAYDSSDPWVLNEGEEFIVGFEASGSLSITAGSDVTANMPTYIGDYALEAAGTTGTLLLTGLGSTLTIDPDGESELFIGPLAEGNLTVTDHAILTSHDAIIAGSPAEGESEEVTEVVEGLGYATVSNGGQWSLGDEGWLTVGAAGQGELAITGEGSTVTGETAEVALLPDSTGDVLVDQSGSWALDSDLVVGVWGEGSLTVSGGGQVQSARSWVGGVDRDTMEYDEPIFDELGEADGTGTVVVTGAGSQWDAGNLLLVGSWGTGDVRIEDGGQVTAQEVFVGGMPIELEEGQPFSWDLVADGTGTVTVSGEGSALNVTGDDTLFVGYSSTGTLDVNEGGVVNAGGVVVGGAPGATGTILVHDAGSQLVSAEELLIGAWGEGDLRIYDGGAVQAETLMAGGFEPNDTGLAPEVEAAFGDPKGTGIILVSGENSTLDVFGAAYIGYSGNAHVDVNEGGAATSFQTVLGVVTGGYGEINVDGSGSVWHVNQDGGFEEDTGRTSGVMVVGGYGEGAVNVTDGGLVDVEKRLYVGGYSSGGIDEGIMGGDPNGTGVVNVTGEGSTVQTDGLVVGFSSEGTVNVENGGSLVSQTALVGFDPNSSGQVLVDGAGSTWENAGSALVGAYGQADVTVSGGGQFSVGQLLLVGGFDADESDFDPSGFEYDPNHMGVVTVTGENSLVEAYAIGVGVGGTGSVQVLDGGTLETQIGVVGAVADSVGTVVVDGEGSTWRLAGDGGLPDDLGTEGEGTLVVSNGGLVELDGWNAALSVDDQITIGSEGQGTLTVINGARVFSDEVVLGGTDPEFESLEEYLDPNAGLGTGTGTAAVNGPGSLLETDDLYVGFSGTGDLTIRNGGQVIDGSAWIGVMPGAVGTVLVTEPESTWSNTQSLVVGAWGLGDLTISGGGYVSAPEVFIGGASFDAIGEDYDPNLTPTGTGTVDVTGAGSELEVTSDATLYVGYSGTGGLDVNDGGAVNSGSVIIGAVPDAIGVVTVDGVGSTLTTEDVQVGAWGWGYLSVLGGAEVTAHYVAIAGLDASDTGLPEAMLDDFGEPNGTGTVAVTGAGSSLETETLLAGVTGQGTVQVAGGGQINAELAVIGLGEGSTGTVTVTGHDSVFQLQGIGEEEIDYGVLAVGGWGTGQVTVSNGALVDASRVYIGGLNADELADRGEDATWGEGDPAGTGTVTVIGEGSGLNVSGDQPLYVGYSGVGTLTASEGGQVEANALMIGAGPNATGTVTIDDGALTVAQDVIVGGWGQGNLTVSNGGQASAGTLIVGGFDESQAPGELAEELGNAQGTGTVAITGEDSVLDVTGDGGVQVGYSGQGTLEILDGAEVTSRIGIVGVTEGGVGQVTVDDALWRITEGEVFDEEVQGLEEDPTWTAEGEGTLTISNGGMVIVEEANALLDVGGMITVGAEGEDSGLAIAGGAKVFSDSAGIGALPGSSGAATIDDEGSEWDNSGSMFVGGYGEGLLVINNGGLLDVHDTLYIGGFDPDQFDIDTQEIGYEPNGTGDVTVTGEGSTLYGTGLDWLYVGYSGAGGLSVLDGGYVESGTTAIGFLPGSEGEVLVHGLASGEMGLQLLFEDPNPGASSTWENTGRLVVGGYGEGFLTVSGGGQVYAEDTYIGGFDPDAGIFVMEDLGNGPNGTGTVVVADEGSLFETGALVVGTTGEGGMIVTDGGQVNSEVGLIAFGPDSTGEVHVTGANSNWTMNYFDEGEEDWSILGVGIYGQGQLVISDGGQVSVADAVVGGFDLEDIGAGGYGDLWGDPNGTGTVIVSGESSLLDVEYDLCIGHSGPGRLFVSDDAWVNAGDVIIGDEPNGVGLTIVDGEWSWLNVSDDLYVGGHGIGDLLIDNGALVAVDDDTHIAYGPSSIGTINVTGEGSVLQVGANLYVGGDDEGAGGLGRLFVNDGGQVTVLNELIVWESGLVGGDGTISVLVPTTLHNYGTIAPGNEGIGTLTVEGTVVFHEGSTFAVDINDTTSDRLAVDGDATIEGGTVEVSSTGTITGSHQYEILTANSVVGEFNDLDTAMLNFTVSQATLDYNETSVWLNVTAANFDDPNIARTDNQRAVGGALQVIGGQGGNDITDALQDLETADGVRGAYDQLSGQTRPPLAPMTVAGSSKFLGTVTSRVQNVQTGLVAGAFDFAPMAMAAGGPDQAVSSPVQDAAARGQTFAVGNGSRVLAAKRWGLWGRGYGLFGDRDAEGGVPGYSYNIYGGSFGVDYQITESILAGVVGGLSQGDADFCSSRDNTEFDAAHFGLYGSVARGPWFVDAVATFATLDYETERFVDLLNERLTGNFDGDEFAAYVEASRNFDLNPKLRLAPLASLQYTYLTLDSYTETGGASALTFDEQTQESIRGSLGARLTQRIAESTGDFYADLQVRGRWVHEFGDDRSSVESAFVSDPTVVFTVRDGKTSRDSAILGTGLSAQLNEHAKVYVDYDARLNSDETVQVISASLQYRW